MELSSHQMKVYVAWTPLKDVGVYLLIKKKVVAVCLRFRFTNSTWKHNIKVQYHIRWNNEWLI